jgi:hypothetical protein
VSDTTPPLNTLPPRTRQVRPSPRTSHLRSFIPHAPHFLRRIRREQKLLSRYSAALALLLKTATASNAKAQMDFGEFPSRFVEFSYLCFQSNTGLLRAGSERRRAMQDNSAKPRNFNPMSVPAGSTFSGLLTRIEIGHIASGQPGRLPRIMFFFFSPAGVLPWIMFFDQQHRRP